ncbi:hypothetical protein [Pseudomonas fluorescens]|uniref:hypothetical protein n=1 Tax=Pseudomonas fluorescens TaxID=294 RepID=UPI0011CD7959|nr:hypothetical protein [Pseudomonas fluorescens]
MDLLGLMRDFFTEMDVINAVSEPQDSKSDFTIALDFTTTTKGVVNFSKKANAYIQQITHALHINRKSSTRVEKELYYNFVREVISELYANGAANRLIGKEGLETKKELTDSVEQHVINRVSDLTHHFPAWTLRMECDSPYIIGPVTISNHFNWIDSLDLPDKMKKDSSGNLSEHANWKDDVKEILKDPKNCPPKDSFFSNSIYEAIAKHPAIVSVTIDGYEREMSRKLAEIIGKSALDAISLGLNSRDYFFQQTLNGERLPAVSKTTITSKNGVFDSYPGLALAKTIPSMPPKMAQKAVATLAPYTDVVGKILTAISNPSSSPHPELSNRWATALDWYAEGCRETSDAIAVAKMGTSLDVLCNGGKAGGILDMTSNLLGIPQDKIITNGQNPKTLKKLIEDVYNAGRSQILHGTQYNRLNSYSEMRKLTEQIARDVLLNAAMELNSYTGDDEDKAFRKMRKAPSINQQS